mgnify:CR=1 FL=1
MSGIVYKLYADEVNFYVGSTKCTARARLSEHRSSAATGRGRSKLYKKMREIGIDEWQLEVLEEAADEDLRDLEQKYIEELGPSLNSRRANVLGERASRRLWKETNSHKYACSCDYHTSNKHTFQRHVTRGLSRGEEHERVEAEQEEQEE